MKIGFISGHSCIRAQKIALGLIGNHHEIHFISGRIPSFGEFYKSTHIFLAIEQLKHSIRQLDPIVDLWHVHNEPSYYVSLVKEFSNKPVVLDIHDSHAARMTHEKYEELVKDGKKALRIVTDERNNFQLADALVYPSETFKDIVESTYGLADFEKTVLYSYVPRAFNCYDSMPYVGGITYEGRVDLPEEIEKDGCQGYNYTDYTDFAKECVDSGIDFYLYPTRNDKKFQEHYKGTATLAKGLKFEKLIKALSGHDWGLVGNLNENDEWQVAMPNKMFEYIAAGIPIACFNAPQCAKFIEKHNIGMAFNSIEELKGNWMLHEQFRNNVLMKRESLAMENNVGELVLLYDKLLESPFSYRFDTKVEEHE